MLRFRRYRREMALARELHFTFEAIEGPAQDQLADCLHPPAWAAHLLRYRQTGSVRHRPSLLDEFFVAVGMPSRAHVAIGRKLAIARMRDYLAIDPIWSRRRNAPDVADAWAHNFVGLFAPTADFYIDGGAVRSVCGLSLVGCDDERIGGIWLEDDD
jgi:hypothetical protein